MVLKDGAARRVRFERSVARLPNLAIHMNRQVNEEGLKFNKQSELPLLLATLEGALPPQEHFLRMLADRLDCAPKDIAAWEMNVYDTQPGAFWGLDGEFIADSQLDNLASCHAALSALLATCGNEVAATRLCIFFDHEEIGSESAKGADGSFLADVLERIALALGTDRQGYLQALANSFCISSDMAHAYQQLSGRLRAAASHQGERRTGDQAQRQPTLCHGKPVGSAFRRPVRSGRRALPALCPPYRPGLRQHHRTDHRRRLGSPHRGRGQSHVGHAQHPRKRRGAGP